MIYNDYKSTFDSCESVLSSCPIRVPMNQPCFNWVRVWGRSRGMLPLGSIVWFLSPTFHDFNFFRNRFSTFVGDENPLLQLEKFVNTEEDYVLRQVGFCAQWCLDNLLPVENRKYSYNCVDTSNINMMLNSNDVRKDFFPHHD